MFSYLPLTTRKQNIWKSVSLQKIDKIQVSQWCINSKNAGYLLFWERVSGSPALNLLCIQRWMTSNSGFSYLFLLSAGIVSVNRTNIGSCFNHLSIVCILSWRFVVCVTWGTPAPTFQYLWFCPSLSIWNAFVCLRAHSFVNQRKKDTITSYFGFKNIKKFDHYFLWPIGKYLQIIILKKPGMELIHEMPSLGSWVKRVISSRSQ